MATTTSATQQATQQTQQAQQLQQSQQMQQPQQPVNASTNPQAKPTAGASPAKAANAPAKATEVQNKVGQNNSPAKVTSGAPAKVTTANTPAKPAGPKQNVGGPEREDNKESVQALKVRNNTLRLEKMKQEELAFRLAFVKYFVRTGISPDQDWTVGQCEDALQKCLEDLEALIKTLSEKNVSKTSVNFGETTIVKNKLPLLDPRHKKIYALLKKHMKDGKIVESTFDKPSKATLALPGVTKNTDKAIILFRKIEEIHHSLLTRELDNEIIYLLEAHDKSQLVKKVNNASENALSSGPAEAKEDEKIPKELEEGLEKYFKILKKVEPKKGEPRVTLVKPDLSSVLEEDMPDRLKKAKDNLKTFFANDQTSAIKRGIIQQLLKIFRANKAAWDVIQQSNIPDITKKLIDDGKVAADRAQALMTLFNKLSVKVNNSGPKERTNSPENKQYNEELINRAIFDLRRSLSAKIRLASTKLKDADLKKKSEELAGLVSTVIRELSRDNAENALTNHNAAVGKVNEIKQVTDEIAALLEESLQLTIGVSGQATKGCEAYRDKIKEILASLNEQGTIAADYAREVSILLGNTTVKDTAEQLCLDANGAFQNAAREARAERDKKLFLDRVSHAGIEIKETDTKEQTVILNPLTGEISNTIGYCATPLVNLLKIGNLRVFANLIENAFNFANKSKSDVAKIEAIISKAVDGDSGTYGPKKGLENLFLEVNKILGDAQQYFTEANNAAREASKKVLDEDGKVKFDRLNTASRDAQAAAGKVAAELAKAEAVEARIDATLEQERRRRLAEQPTTALAAANTGPVAQNSGVQGTVPGPLRFTTQTGPGANGGLATAVTEPNASNGAGAGNASGSTVTLEDKNRAELSALKEKHYREAQAAKRRQLTASMAGTTGAETGRAAAPSTGTAPAKTTAPAKKR